MAKNVLIATMARSRSSVFVRLFVEHGWNPGAPPREADQWNRSGYLENKALKKFARERRENPYRAIIEGRDPRLYADVTDVLPPAPWVQKVDAFCIPAFSGQSYELFRLYRDEDAILESCLKTPFMFQQGYSPDEWRKIIRAHHHYMDGFEGHRVEADVLVRGTMMARFSVEVSGGRFDEDAWKHALAGS